ncbi:M23 family metallopeptidase [Bacteroides sp. GD17]|jgi:murein DD-endopeptidase MepM/ murein hydrolase activator NlpD|uniref:M23 family metallopeptidase n=1 Tax=Bacteroides sp. GD17 TaxID=3139826 RepID=UPI0025FC5FCA|nr:M23 family metallopeptidase [uncultured Bacteroides sp.]
MKFTSIISILLITFSTVTQAKNPPFTSMEINHIRVATPGLFDNTNQIEIYLDTLPDAAYAFPLPGAKVISPYGGARRHHSGIDIKTRAKDTIRCAFDGVVRMAKPYSAYGNVIVVRHSFGLETIYSHNFKNLVQSGDTVKAGQPIALTGRTGRATTEHLHFETRINGQHFDPTLIFDMKERTLNKRNISCTRKGNGIIVKQLPMIYRPRLQKKYPLEPYKYPNLSLHLQNVSLPTRIEL